MFLGSNIENLSESLSNMSLNGNNATNTNIPTIQAAKEIASTIKTFSGRSEHLEYFINSVDRFFNRYGRTTDNSLSEFVFAAICSKIIDQAGDFLLCRSDLNTWPEIKAALRNKFGDRTNRHILQQQFIYLSRGKNENILDFLDRIKLLKMKLNLKINSDPDLDQPTKYSLINQNEVTAVTVLISNTHSELRTLLMLQKPKDIDEATSLVINHALFEQQINLRQNSQQTNRQLNTHKQQHKDFIRPNHSRYQSQSQYIPNERTFAPPTQQYFPQQFYQTPRQFSQSYNQTNFPSQPINIQPRQTQQKRFLTNREVFGKPANVFSPNPNFKPQNKTEPMSTTSRTPSARLYNNQRQNYFQQTSPRNFISEELTNLETDNQIINSEINDGQLPPEYFDNYDDCYLNTPNDNQLVEESDNDTTHFNHQNFPEITSPPDEP